MTRRIEFVSLEPKKLPPRPAAVRRARDTLIGLVLATTVLTGLWCSVRYLAAEQTRAWQHVCGQVAYVDYLGIRWPTGCETSQ